MQIVHDDQIEAAGVLFETPRLGQRYAGRVVDEDAGLDQLVQGILQLDLVFSTDHALLEHLLIDPGLGGEHAAKQRLLAHFQAEDGHHGFMIDGCILRDVDGQGSLAHGRAGGDDDQLALLQMAPKEPATILSSGWRPWVSPFSVTSSNCCSVMSSTPMAS